MPCSGGPKRRVSRVRFLLVALWLTWPALACLNIFEHTLDGREVDVGFQGSEEPASIRRHDLKEWQARLQQLARPATLEQRNDRAVALVHLGRAPEALSVFQQLEKEAPGRYQTATNLGTCYELTGDDAEALVWIREGIKRNPESHDGTEWLHVRILETKLRLAKDPAWLQSHTVLGYDFGKEPRPAWPSQLAQQSERSRVRRALERQLQERAPLVAPPDPIVADLLVALANLRALDTSAERGQAWMELALTYQPAQLELARARQAFFAEASGKHPSLGAFWRAAWFRSALAVLAVLGVLIAWQSRRRP